MYINLKFECVSHRGSTGDLLPQCTVVLLTPQVSQRVASVESTSLFYHIFFID